MIAYCKTNNAFEDTLTSSKHYPVIELRNGSVRIVDDRGHVRWFGLSRFALQHATQKIAC